MPPFNASDPKQIRAAEKRDKAARAQRQRVILNVMLDPSGRHYIHDRLVACHIFSSSFSLDALAMAFAEGERSVGLQLLGDIMAAAPDQYIQMMREASDREQADGRDTNSNRNDGPERDRQDERRDDSGRPDDTDGSADGSVESEYNPADHADE